MDMQLDCEVTHNGKPFLSNSLTYHNVDAGAVAFITKHGMNLLPHLSAKHTQGAEFQVSLSASIDGKSSGPAVAAQVSRKGFLELERKLFDFLPQVVDEAEKLAKAGGKI